MQCYHLFRSYHLVAQQFLRFIAKQLNSKICNENNNFTHDYCDTF